jgi:hypothetical protein
MSINVTVGAALAAISLSVGNGVLYWHRYRG